MMKLKHIIQEYGFYPENEATPFTPVEAQYITNMLYDYMKFETLIFRGLVNLNVEGYEVKTIRSTRKLKDTPRSINDLINGYLHFVELENIFPDRQSALFASTRDTTAGQFGRILTVIFPDKHSTIWYNEDIQDSYYFTNVGGLNTLYTIASANEHDAELVEEFLNTLEVNQVKHLIFNIYSAYSRGLNSPTEQIKRLNYNSIISELKKVLYELSEPTKEITRRNSTELNNLLFYSLQKQTKFFQELIQYIDNVKTFKYENHKPFPLSNRDDVELVISGTKYFAIDYYKFKKTFEWSEVLKTWVVKPQVKKENK